MEIKDYNQNELSAANNKLIAGSDIYNYSTEEEKIIVRRILKKNLILKGSPDVYDSLIQQLES